MPGYIFQLSMDSCYIIHIKSSLLIVTKVYSLGYLSLFSLDSYYSIHVTLLLNLDSDISIDFRVYGLYYHWKVSIAYILEYTVLLYLDSDLSIYVSLYISVFSG